MADGDDAILLQELDERLRNSTGSTTALADTLPVILQHFGCAAGTIHVRERAGDTLTLVAHHGIPDFVLGKIQSVPLGKGIAGVAAQEARPVQLCNLQTDTSGVARPGAKQTKVEGSLAVPILSGDEVRGTLGVGKLVPYEFTEAESDLLTKAGRLIANHLPE